MALDIIYQDDHILAINKPHGLLVHRSPIAKDVSENALNLLRVQIQRNAHPAHRVDRKTSGVLLFALDDATNSKVQVLFAQRLISKKYLAIVRGYTDNEGEINYPLKKENGKVQEAITRYRTINRAELDIPFGKNDTIRYSLVEVTPETGRMHQIRKHFAHIMHPIIADRPYGCNKQNGLFKQRWNMDSMMLHASSLTFRHPLTDQVLHISAPVQSAFRSVADMMGWEV